MNSSISRRAVLGLVTLGTLAGCAAEQPVATGRSPASPAGEPQTPPPPSSPPQPSPTPVPGRSAPVRHDRLAALERTFGARLGVYALHTGTGAVVEHRADERFAFCSTFKGLAVAAVLDRHPMSHLDTLVRYRRSDLLERAPITRRNLGRGMTIRQLCDAAVRYSDGTAGNLLVRDLGGPAELTKYLRGLGDRVTRMDRVEPAVAAAVPGDPRDTSSPRALGTTYQRLVLGDALPADRRAFLRDLLERNTTGDRRIRAGLPRTWRTADKTGTGDYGTLNDIAITWPPGSAPLLVAIMSSKPAEDAEHDEALLARAAAYVAGTLT